MTTSLGGASISVEEEESRKKKDERKGFRNLEKFNRESEGGYLRLLFLGGKSPWRC